MLTLDLRPLRETEALELARSLAIGATTMLSDCVQRAEGNPLFLEQLLRSALAGDQEALPGSVQSIVLSRLDRLPPRDRQAIQAASVLGQYFSLPVLRDLIGDAGYTCAALIAGNLIRPMSGEFLFAHALDLGGHLRLPAERSETPVACCCRRLVRHARPGAGRRAL